MPPFAGLTRTLRSRYPVRSWSSGFAERRVYAWPKPSIRSVGQRLETNVAYFAANYAIIGGLSMLFAALTTPVFAVSLLLVAALWVWLVVLRETDDGSLVLPRGLPPGRSADAPRLRVPPLPLYVGAAGGSLLLLVGAAASGPGGLAVAAWLTFVLAHSILRKRSVKAQASLFVRQTRSRVGGGAPGAGGPVGDVAAVVGGAMAAAGGDSVAIDLSGGGGHGGGMGGHGGGGGGVAAGAYGSVPGGGSSMYATGGVGAAAAAPATVAQHQHTEPVPVMAGGAAASVGSVVGAAPQDVAARQRSRDQRAQYAATADAIRQKYAAGNREYRA